MSSSMTSRTPTATDVTPESDSEDDLALEKHEHMQVNDTTHPRRAASTPDDEIESPSDASDDEEPVASFSRHHVQRRSTTSKTYTTGEEQAVLRKLDRRLVLFLALLYLLSFLDRSNIGNARVAGLEDSLSLSSSQFDWLLTAFYITYITFEWMILLYKLIPPHIYISICVLCWGLVASCQSLTTTFPQLLILRSLLGITEAAFGPGVPFYMTFFYRREELAYRVGLQISAAPLATSFAASLAWCIVKLNTALGSPIDSWRALFLVEGFPSILAAVAAFYWIPDSPSTARWLTGPERRIATLRIKAEQTARPTPSNPTPTKHRFGLNLTDLKSTLLDPKSHLQALMFFSVNVSFASLPVFLPTIINSMSFSPLTSQALAAPPYLLAFATVLIVGHYSDKLQDSRSLFLSAVAALSCVSYVSIAVAGALHERIGEAGSITIRYVAVYPAAIGLFSSVTLIITWTLNNQQSSSGKGMAMTVLNVVGQCGPLVGVRLFPDRDGPLYVRGMSVCGGFMGGVVVVALGLRWWLGRLNRGVEIGKGAYEMVVVGGQGDGEDEGLMKGSGGGGRREDEERYRFML